jgi:hypothetical protein
MEGLALFGLLFLALAIICRLLPDDGTTSGPLGGSRTHPPEKPRPTDPPPSNRRPPSKE